MSVRWLLEGQEIWLPIHSIAPRISNQFPRSIANHKEPEILPCRFGTKYFPWFLSDDRRAPLTSIGGASIISGYLALALLYLNANVSFNTGERFTMAEADRRFDMLASRCDLSTYFATDDIRVDWSNRVSSRTRFMSLVINSAQGRTIEELIIHCYISWFVNLRNSFVYLAIAWVGSHINNPSLRLLIGALALEIDIVGVLWFNAIWWSVLIDARIKYDGCIVRTKYRL